MAKHIGQCADPWSKAKRTELLGRTFAQLALTKLGYNRVFLLSKKKNEPTGIVDMVAVKKRRDQHGRLDATEIVLIQVKGNQKVSQKEVELLRNAVHKVTVKAGVIEYWPGKLAKLVILPE